VSTPGSTGTARRIALVIAGLVIGSMVTAGFAGASTKPPRHDDYVERADAICSRTTAKIDAAVEDLGLSPSDDEARDAGDRVVELLHAQVDKLRALTPPRGEARRVEKVYDAVERAVDRVEDDPESLFDEPSPFTRAARLAERYGFEECGQG
jgi:hypothetical protein